MSLGAVAVPLNSREHLKFALVLSGVLSQQVVVVLDRQAVVSYLDQGTAELVFERLLESGQVRATEIVIFLLGVEGLHERSQVRNSESQ